MKNKAIVTGVLVLVMAFFVGIVGAQEETDERPHHLGRGLLGDIIETITEATDLTVQEILEQLRDGATLTEVIENAGGDVDAVIADIEEEVNRRIDDMFNTEFDFTARDGGIRDRVRNGVVGEVVTAVTDATGLEATGILQQLRDGATLADIITENDGDVDALIDTVVTAVTDAVNQRVADEDITQDQADQILENLEQTVTDFVNGDLELNGRSFGNENGRGRGNN